MRKAFIVIATITLVTVLFGAYFAYSEIQMNQNGEEPIFPQPPLPHMIPEAKNVTGTSVGSEAISIALANNEVKQYTDKGYQLYGVFQSDNTYWVGILTNEQQLPWVFGISLIVPVQFNSSEPIFVNFELALTNLTQSQKQETLRIASDTIKTYGGDATIGDVTVNHWEDSIGNNTTFHAFPCVHFRVPEDFHKVGVDLTIYIDLQKGQVIRVFSNPSKPLF
jgi:hypothetical protein